MNTTLKQQIKAVKRAHKYLAHLPTTSACLNDACSTLAAVAMIGEDKIKALPQIIKAAQKVCDEGGPYNIILLRELLNTLNNSNE